MYKVLIVDDEAIFREYLRNVIDWNAHGFVVSGEAKDGLEALELIKNVIPDVALVDINMPLMDGLDFASKLKDFHYETIVVLVTGYSEFEYARRALKIGVEDYILKPFDNEELIMTLLKIKARLQIRKNAKSLQMEDNNLVKEMFFKDIISNEYCSSDEDTKRQLERFGIKLNSLLFSVSSIEIDNIYQRWSDPDEILLWKNAVANVLNEVIVVKGNQFIFNGFEDRIISIIEFEDEESLQEFSAESYLKFCTLIREYLEITVTVGIGSTVTGLKSIRRSYSESLTALQNKFMEANGKVIEYCKLQNEYKNAGFYTGETNEKLLMSLRLGDWEATKAGLDEVYRYILESMLSIDYIYVTLMGLESLCFSYITESGKNIEEVFGKNFAPFKAIKEIEYLNAAFKQISDIYKETIDFFSKNKITRSRKVVDTVCEYILSNYSDNELSVEKISRNIYVDTSYIRRLFRKELNMTVIDYITDIRMQKAKELLGKRNMKLSEVAEKIGYNDNGYFSKCFKKYFGISPSTYENIKN